MAVETMPRMLFRRLQRHEIPTIWTIDRAEYIERIYVFRDGELVLEPHNFQVPGWPPGKEEESTPLLYEVFDRGGVFPAAFDGERLAGVAAVDTLWRGPNGDLLQLETLYVSNGYRKQGLGTRLFNDAREIALEHGAKGLYISATPSENTVNFYLGLGATLVAEPDPELFAREPDDIHLVCPV
jgi:GNAT superfamily N-acetyltransferase